MVATRFAVAVHIMLLLACRRRATPATSQLIAQSVNTNPVVVRRITGQLARAGLVHVRRGPGGAELTRSPEHITLADVWLATNTGRAATVLPVHADPNLDCPIGREVHAVLGRAFDRVEQAMLDALRGTTLASLTTSLPAEAA
jgi:Rrf2 family protein